MCADAAHSGLPIVALVDPRLLLRISLTRALSQHLPGFMIVGSASADDLVRDFIPNLRAILLSLDASMTKAGVGPSLSAVKAVVGDVPIALLVDHACPTAVQDASRSGARAFVTTTMSIEVAAAVIRLVVSGGTHFPHDNFSPEPAERGYDEGLVSRLTQREREVLRLVSQGAPNKSIAYTLSMSENTVKVHLHRILQKFRMHNRTEVALLAGRYFSSSEGHLAPMPMSNGFAADSTLWAAPPVALPDPLVLPGLDAPE